MFATYSEVLEYLYGRLPVFQNQGASAYKKDLTNIIALCESLQHPERSFKSIHVAGTNGKGSVSSMLAAICTRHGLKTGLYTSPHLKDFRERIRLNGEMIDEEFVRHFVSSNLELIERINPSFFEVTVAMAYAWFALQQVDIAVIEVGLGGRLDSTNIITPELSVITNIGWDHADLLGPTLKNIAFEKAGIIKQGVPIVLGEWDDETGPVFREVSSQNKSLLRIANLNPEWENHRFRGSLLGNYQQKNMRTVWESVRELQRQGMPLQDDLVQDAMMRVGELSCLRGRWEILQEEAPFIVADTAHNEPGIKDVMRQVTAIPCRTRHLVLGFVKEKDLDKIMPLFPGTGRYYFCRPSIERGLDADTLRNRAAAFGLYGNSYPSVTDAIAAAKADAGPEDVIYIGGSTFVVAEAIS